MSSGTDYRYVTTQLYQSGSTPNPIIGEFPFTNVNFTQQLSSIGVFTGELLISGFDNAVANLDAATTPGQTALYVFKGDNPVWAGIIWLREWDTETQMLKITAREMLSYYEHRRIYGFTTSSYYNANLGGTGVGGLGYGTAASPVDPLLIFRDLLTGANARTPHGNIGVTWASSNPSTVSGGSTVYRAFFNFEMKPVYQAWKDLAQSATFFDFVIKPRISSGNIINEVIIGSPQLGVTYSAASPNSINLQFPGNILHYIYTEDAANVGNYMYGIGYGANQNRIIQPWYDSDKLTGAGIWPLLENSMSLTDIVDSNLVSFMAKGKLGAVSYPPTTVQVVLNSYTDPVFNPSNTGSYNIGDQVNLVISDDRFYTGSAAIYRIIGMNVEPGENGPDRITLTLNSPLATTLVAG